MKKGIVITILITVISMGTFAQSLKIGVEGGATLNKISGQTFSQKFTYGHHLGAFATIGVSKKLAIQPEVVFNQINLDTSSKFSDVYSLNKISNVQLKYLSIPIFLNYKLSHFITLQAGPQYAILMNRNKTLLENGQAAFKSGDFSMVGGLQLTVSHFRVYGRYVVGLNSINDLTNQDNWKNQSVQLGIGLIL